jgi:hypothetical protein
MPTTIIKVYDKRNAKWAEGAKVGIGRSVIINLGMSKNVYNDSSGKAVIEHFDTADTEVYINGKYVGNI